MRRLQRQLCTALMLGFLLGSYKGYLALWEDEDPEPRQIYPLPLASLPQADQDALEQGIHVRNQKALNRLLEDYLS